MTKTKIAVLGASGYTGSELVRMLLRHPNADITTLTADRRAGQEMRAVYPQFSPFALPKLISIDEINWGSAPIDLVFCALPHGTTQEVIKKIFAAKPSMKVVDVSADFRLTDLAAYAKWYGHPHQAVDLQKQAVYGLTEIYRDKIKNAKLVANPGCYTTCAQLPLIPLLREKAIETSNIVIDAKSGMTGAGRAAKENMLFSEVSEGFHAYGVGNHRHMAELDQEFSLAAGEEVLASFTPHLMPANRGILSTIYVRGAGGTAGEVLHGMLSKFYAKEHFVHVLPFGETPQSRHVRGSNMTFIGMTNDRKPGRAIIVSTLDNLVKGASGQAIQNMNVMLGLPEATGIDQIAMFP